MKERIVIVFIAAVLGLLLTTAGYFIYQTAVSYSEQNKDEEKPLDLGGKTKEQKEEEVTALSITEPANEQVMTKRTIEVKGRTYAENTVIVTTNSEDVVGTPAQDGKFSVSVTIDAGVNKITTRSVSPSGEEIIDERIVTYSTEEF